MSALPNIGSSTPESNSMRFSRTHSFSGRSQQQHSSELWSHLDESKRPYSASSLVSNSIISISKESIGSSHTGLSDETSFIWLLKQGKIKSSKGYVEIAKTASKDKTALGYFEDVKPRLDDNENQISFDQSNLHYETLPKVNLQSNVFSSSLGNVTGQDASRTSPSYLYGDDYVKPLSDEPFQKGFLFQSETLGPVKSAIHNSPNFKLIPRSAGQRLKLLNTKPTTKVISSAHSDYLLGKDQKVKGKDQVLDYNTRSLINVGSCSITFEFEKLSYGIMEEANRKIHSKMRNGKSFVQNYFSAHNGTTLAIDSMFPSSECPLQRIFDEEIKSYRIAVETANNCTITIEKLKSQDSIDVLKSMTKILSFEFSRISAAPDILNFHSSLLGGSISPSQLHIKTKYSDSVYESYRTQENYCVLACPSTSFLGLAKLFGTSLLSSAVLDAFPNLVLDWDGLNHTTISQRCLEELKLFRAPTSEMFCIGRLVYSLVFSYFSRGLHLSVDPGSEKIREIITQAIDLFINKPILLKSITSSAVNETDTCAKKKIGKPAAFTRSATPCISRKVGLKEPQAFPATKSISSPGSRRKRGFSIQKLQNTLFEHSIMSDMDEYSIYDKFSWSMFQDILRMDQELFVFLRIILKDKQYFHILAGDSKWLDEIRKLAIGVGTLLTRDRLVRTSSACGRFLAWCRRIISEVINILNYET